MPWTTVREREVRIPVELGPPTAGPVHAQELEGNLTLPEAAMGLILFAHGSGSSRFSPRNRFVARSLQESGFGTLLIDLLSPEEEALDVRTAELRFNIPFLARRLVEVIDWLAEEPDTQELALGLFGASTGAAAALIAAVERPERVKAVVSRGGRPDLAMEILPRVQPPTLLIVGGEDHAVLEMNQAAFEQLRCRKVLWVVPGATHLFEEPGALEQVASLASDWFRRRLHG